jgi:methylated-DNA-[protein]-cysteine S-methyltransferase
MHTAYLNTPLGTACITGDEQGITAITILDEQVGDSEIIHESLEDACQQLREYFLGDRQGFDLNLNPTGTDFQKKVWNALVTIPYGKTISYHTLSKNLGDVKAIRAAASANAKNPLWVVVPCHRVIGSDGSLTGYAGGLHRKKWLLDHESPFKQLVLF